MSIQTVWLHVGHGKTGSSFIQSALAASVPVLDAVGLHYPIYRRIYDRARAGHVSSGNMAPEAGALRNLLDRVPTPAGTTDILLSNEGLFHALFRKERLIDEVREAFPGAKIKMLLFIRDPMDHMISSYHQAVKRSGFLDSLDTYSENYSIPSAVVGFLDAAAAEGIELTVHNYSRHADALLPLVEKWLGLAPDALVRPPVERVNRSMTNAELELQRAFTRHLGKESSRFISDPLCDRLPDVDSETPGMSSEGLKRFLDRIGTLLSELNGKVPADEAYRIGTEADYADMLAVGREDSMNLFSNAQLEVLAEAIGAHIKALQDQLTMRSPRHSDATEIKSASAAPAEMTKKERQERQRQRSLRMAAKTERERKKAERETAKAERDDQRSPRGQSSPAA
ncbi:hypothetical protein RGD00_17625 [Xinfangfangia sp. LG-4]|uniref:Sulfotransferase domain-containing protein n=2 Tax=Ruixingdingia sedimenti TaxID=3073604 RepID=A0ABU1FC06_9RHOB|nr:hypothetical protein [Xinfangfangia sp. LG-4]